MRERTFFVIAVVVLLGVALFGHDKVNRNIADVSWPNCGTKHQSNYQSGIVGVTGGLDFHSNPCLARESTWFLRYAVYTNTGYPGDYRGRRYMSSPRPCGTHDSQCLAYNYGFNATKYAIRYADLQNVHAGLWWLDVETLNSWTTNYSVNRQFLSGTMAAIRQDVWFANIGIYSSSNQWQEIVGPWHNKLSAWLATGSTSYSEAAKACLNKPFNSGSIWLSQYTTDLDQNVACTNQFNDYLTQSHLRLAR